MNDRTFQKSNRLLKSSDFQWRRIKTKRWEKGPFSFLVRSNQLDCGRLGLIISRKNVKRAVMRNRIKRIARESFRLNKSLMCGFDIILIAKKGAETLDRITLRRLLDEQWTTGPL